MTVIFAEVFSIQVCWHVCNCNTICSPNRTRLPSLISLSCDSQMVDRIAGSLEELPSSLEQPDPGTPRRQLVEVNPVLTTLGIGGAATQLLCTSSSSCKLLCCRDQALEECSVEGCEGLTKLTLRDRGLTGTLPAAFEKLTKLQSLCVGCECYWSIEHSDSRTGCWMNHCKESSHSLAC